MSNLASASAAAPSPTSASWHGDSGVDDEIFGDSNDTIYGFGGDDIIDGGGGNDEIFGGSGEDDLNGNTGNDTIWGGLQDDTIRGGAGQDYLYGEQGHDTIYGDSGDIVTDGEVVPGSAGRGDPYSDDPYSDATPYSAAFAPLSFNTQSSSANFTDAQLFGLGKSIADLAGASQATAPTSVLISAVLNQRRYNDVLKGGRGNDKLYGELGSDKLYGEAGNDLLNGYGGTANERDVLTGGDGSDRFVLGDATAQAYYRDADGYALVTDFKAAEGDKFQVYGSAQDYTLSFNGGSTNILYLGSRIATVRGTQNVRLQRDFLFVGGNNNPAATGPFGDVGGGLTAPGGFGATVI